MKQQKIKKISSRLVVVVLVLSIAFASGLSTSVAYSNHQSCVAESDGGQLEVNNFENNQLEIGALEEAQIEVLASPENTFVNMEIIITWTAVEKPTYPGAGFSFYYSEVYSRVNEGIWNFIGEVELLGFHELSFVPTEAGIWEFEVREYAGVLGTAGNTVPGKYHVATAISNAVFVEIACEVQATPLVLYEGQKVTLVWTPIYGELIGSASYYDHYCNIYTKQENTTGTDWTFVDSRIIELWEDFSYGRQDVITMLEAGTYSVKIEEKARTIQASGGTSTGDFHIKNFYSNPFMVAIDLAPPILEPYNFPSNGEAISDTISLATLANDDSGIDRVEFFFDGACVGMDDRGPYATWFDTKSYRDGKHEIKMVAYDVAGKTTESETRIVTVDNVAEKIAAFFWATDAVTLCGNAWYIMGTYASKVQQEGYQLYSYPDTSNFNRDFMEVMYAEGPKDTLFFFLKGHGNCAQYSDGRLIYSYTYLRAGENSVITSSSFRELILTHMDTPRMALLVESCKSGGWVEHFQDLPYLAMSTADRNHNTVAIDLCFFGIPALWYATLCFSYYYFSAINTGKNAREAFTKADSAVGSLLFLVYGYSYPQISDNSPYTFF